MVARRDVWGLHGAIPGVYEEGMSTLSEAIERRLQAIHRQYDSHFAGQARVTRDPGMLDTMLEELLGVAPELDALSEEERAPLKGLLDERRALYEGEAKAIRETLDDPRSLEIHRVQTWVEVSRWRYDRHFAGHSRLSRDLGLLAEMTEDLARAFGVTGVEGLLDLLGGRRGGARLLVAGLLRSGLLEALLGADLTGCEGADRVS